MNDIDEIHWPPRVSKEKIRRLYLSDARGLLDEDLLNDVGTLLYQRCLAIFTVYEAGKGRVRCPRCERQGRETFIQRTRLPYGQVETITCPTCGWSITWSEYHRSYKRRRLNLGGAADAFRAFVQGWPAARTPQAKMTAVDRLIHAFHYSLMRYPDLPTRPAALNLINANLEDTIQFLNELTFGADTKQQWDQTIETYRKGRF